MARKQEGRSQRGSEPRESGRGGTQSDLDNQSIDELRRLAKDLGIEGRDQLDRQQLIERIRNERIEDPTRGGRTGRDAESGRQGRGSGETWE